MKIPIYELSFPPCHLSRSQIHLLHLNACQVRFWGSLYHMPLIFTPLPNPGCAFHHSHLPDNGFALGTRRTREENRWMQRSSFKSVYAVLSWTIEGVDQSPPTPTEESPNSTLVQTLCKCPPANIHRLQHLKSNPGIQMGRDDS